MKKHGLAVLAFVVATFGTQAASHFIVNADHYASVPYLREQPIFLLGVLAMLIQGSVLSYLYSRMAGSGSSIPSALGFAWLAGGFLVSYTAFAEAAKYTVPAVPSWVTVEAVAGFVQFSLYGVALGLIYRRKRSD